METVLRKTVKDFSKNSEIIQTIVIAMLAFLVPTFLGQLLKSIFGANSVITNNSQIIIGSIVNTALVLTALNLKGIWKTFFVVTMPSISTILSGYVFKTASFYMVWMIPAIWIGNFLLVISFKYLMITKNRNYIVAFIIGIISKVAIIFGCFIILKSLNVFPDKLVGNLQKAMSIIQLITATIGCIISYFIYKVEIKDKTVSN